MAKSGRNDSSNIFQTPAAPPPAAAPAAPPAPSVLDQQHDLNAGGAVGGADNAGGPDAPGDFAAGGSTIGERHTEELVEGTGTGNTELPKTKNPELEGGDLAVPGVAAAPPLEPAKPDTVARPTEPATPDAVRRFSTGFDADDLDASPFSERKARQDPAPNGGQLRYRVWDHGAFMHDGAFYPAGSHVNMPPGDASDAVARGVLSLAQATAGAACPKCGKGTGASLPCSPECYAAAGYNPANFDAFVSERKDEIARREAAGVPMSKR